jgi:glycogen debranching enzyme
LQGYVYDAWLRMAEIYDELGNKRRANVLRKKATALFEKFNEDFWDEQSGFYAFALDGDKKKVLSAARERRSCEPTFRFPLSPSRESKPAGRGGSRSPRLRVGRSRR